MDIIRSENVYYRYPLSEDYSLRGIDFTIEKSKLYAIVGQNGSGKSTLCNLLRGFIPHFHLGELEGNLFIKDIDIRDWNMSELAKEIGFIFENPFTQISGVRDTVFGEVAYGLENLGIEVSKIKKRVDEVSELLGIQDLLDKNPFQLSGGQKQRVAFASVIAMDPDILVIDEPTSQLDPQGTEEIFNIIRILKEQKKTIILVEHKLELIAEYADYILVMNEGRIIQRDTPDKIFSDDKLLDIGCGLPQYSLLGLEIQKYFQDLPIIPTTRQQTLTEITQLVERRKNIEHS